ncbi:MAG: hypothetical protein WCA25_00640 [Pseudolabrys sp.]
MIDDEANEAKAKLNAELLAAGPNDQKDNPAQGSWSFDESSKGYSPLGVCALNKHDCADHIQCYGDLNFCHRFGSANLADF